jgi:beta-N-acetylhexosaminidase
MARSKRWVLGVLSAGALLAGALELGAAPTLARAPARSPIHAVRRHPPGLTERGWIQRTLSRMTIPEEVGQLFEINGFGKSVDDRDPAMVKLNRRFFGVSTIRQLIAKYHPGGFIYFTWNGNIQTPADPAQTVGLSNGIQRLALRQHTPIPMLISTDQEEGWILRIGPPATVFPGSMALGATRDVPLAQRAAEITGIELRAQGINVDNAPVVDVNVNPLNQADGLRTYGDRTGFVSQFATAQVHGYQTAAATKGVGATAKHFPGLGDVELNSDTGAAISQQTLAQVKRTNLPTFRAAIKAGVDRVMAGHIVFPRITGNKVVSSLSPFYVNGLLRHYLHYNGPVVTDALDAAALDAYTPAQVALKAFDAGNDELLEIAYPKSLGGTDNPPGDLPAAYNAMLRAVRTGKISKAQLDQSVLRTLKLKWELGLIKHSMSDPSLWKRTLGTPAHQAVANDAARRSIMLLRNTAGLLPLQANSGRKALVTGFGQTTTATLGQDITGNGLATEVVPTGSDPTSAQIASAVAAAQRNDIVVDSTFNAWNPGQPGQINLYKALIATGKPVIVAAVGTPYDIAYLPGASTFITSVDYQPVSLKALVQAIFGQLNPTGKLPVTITQQPPSKTVLYPFGFGLSYP